MGCQGLGPGFDLKAMATIRNTGILLIDCPDQKGIVLAVADFLYGHNANIVHADQHQDVDTKTFFMRVEWELDDFRLPITEFSPGFHHRRALWHELAIEIVSGKSAHGNFCIGANSLRR